MALWTRGGGGGGRDARSLLDTCFLPRPGVSLCVPLPLRNLGWKPHHLSAPPRRGPRLHSLFCLETPAGRGRTPWLLCPPHDAVCPVTRFCVLTVVCAAEECPRWGFAFPLLIWLQEYLPPFLFLAISAGSRQVLRPCPAASRRLSRSGFACWHLHASP